MRLKNPFTPSVIAALPEDFFGRASELAELSRALQQGSVCIEGPPGIGKSSFLARTLLHVEGFCSDENSIVISAVAHGDILTVDDAARLILEKLALVDQKQQKITISFPKIISFESSEAYSFFTNGRHLAALTRIVEDKAFQQQIRSASYFIIAIDECEKCPVPLARLMRTLGTELQMKGIKNLKFILSGVSPFYGKMKAEDAGVTRFVYETFPLAPLDEDACLDLLNTKFREAIDTIDDESSLYVDPEIIDTIYKISGGHPHLVQLLGSHVIEHEVRSPDGIIDKKDLVDCLRTICYGSRSQDYDLQIAQMKNESKYSYFLTLIELAGGHFPSNIALSDASKTIESDILNWFCSYNLIRLIDENTYSFVDEFLRIRVILDNNSQSDARFEEELISSGEYEDFSEAYELMWENTGTEDEDLER